ncbi:hypothetical protein OAJ14_08095 [Polaribacter sp.]|nr:hypothetical protein [Polaribacter sp.]
MKNLLYLFFAITLLGCSSDEDDDDNASAQTFFEKYDGIVWEQETFNGDKVDKSLSLQRFQFFKDKSIKVYDYEKNTSIPIEDCNQIFVVDATSYYSNITEDSITYEDDIDVIVFTVKDNTLFRENRWKNPNNSEPPEYPSTYSRTSLDDPCE